jgi:exodeoxyribonuclease VIII
MNNVMLDLETFGTSSNSAIFSIGAVSFCKSNGILDRFYVNIDPSDCQKHGLEINADTVVWWMSQSEEARNSVCEPKDINGDKATRLPLKEALIEFTEWLSVVSPPFLGDSSKSVLSDLAVWGCGSDFDNVLIENAYKKVGEKVPWKFRNNRCYRTIKSLFPNIKIERKGTHHNALDDAEHQANHLIEIFKSMSCFDGSDNQPVL